MANVSYVYPNLSGITQRGGLLERWQLAKQLGCDYIGVPADFIKNRTEVKRTGLNLGDFLTKEGIANLYEKDSYIPSKLKYILHTEPSLLRSDGYGLSYQAPLKWYDKEWTEKMVNMLVSVSEFFGMPASILEIYPGDRRNSFEDILRSTRFLMDRYHEEHKVEPLIFIENRTGQSISTGKQISNFWKYLSGKYPHFKSKVGIVLDIQQLFTVTKKNFLKEFKSIPLGALKGFHIHYRHRVPNFSNEIPWKKVLGRIAVMKSDIIINPEIHHKNKVSDAIKFCEGMLRGP